LYHELLAAGKTLYNGRRIMDIPKLALGIALIAGYVALRLGWTYRQDTRRRSGERGFREQAGSALLLILGVLMLAGGLFFILWSMGIWSME
jgi:hypothetical protein